MKLILNTGEFINIDPKYLEGMTLENRGTRTSHLNELLKPYLDSDFKHRVNAYSILQNSLHKEYESYLDLLGGIGLTGKIFGDVPKYSYLNDLDPTCVDILKDNYFKGNVFNQDMFDFDFKRRFDLILADFNDFTLRKYERLYKEVLDKMFDCSDKFVIVNDCSIYSLKFGQKSFINYSSILGTRIATLEDYFPAVKRYFEERHKGWKLIKVEAFRNSSFLLFHKGNSRKFEFNLHKDHNNLVKLKK